MSNFVINPYMVVPSTPESTKLWEQTATGENEGLSTNKTMIGQRFQTGHVLIGKTITRFDAELRKAGSPTGVLQARIINSSNTLKLAMGTLDIATLTTELVTHTFENTDGYVLADGDRIIFYWPDGDGSNVPIWEMCLPPCDEAYTNGSYYLSGSWVERTREFTMSVWGY